MRARRKLATSRGLEDFADSVQPLLLGTFALFVGALTTLLALSGAALREPAAYAQGITLGALLLLARLLTVHGFTHAPTVALSAAAVTEGTALAVDLIGRLPGCGFLAIPVETVLDSLGPGGIPALACGAAALILLFHTPPPADQSLRARAGERAAVTAVPRTGQSRHPVAGARPHRRRQPHHPVKENTR